MAVDIKAAINDLERLTVSQLQNRYSEVFGEPTRAGHKQHLIKRIVWRMQALDEGGLSDRARRRALELADEAEIRLTPPRRTIAAVPGTVIKAAFESGPPSSVPKPGTVIRREYKGRVILVKVLPRGFEYDGEVHRSLTAIARLVTGSHWNGVKFFGLPSTHSKPSMEARA
ncbi:MAG: DUF2924 domain-containing protein [Phycisphaerales bacterium]